MYSLYVNRFSNRFWVCVWFLFISSMHLIQFHPILFLLWNVSQINFLISTIDIKGNGFSSLICIFNLVNLILFDLLFLLYCQFIHRTLIHVWKSLHFVEKENRAVDFCFMHMELQSNGSKFFFSYWTDNLACSYMDANIESKMSWQLFIHFPFKIVKLLIIREFIGHNQFAYIPVIAVYDLFCCCCCLSWLIKFNKKKQCNVVYNILMPFGLNNISTLFV